MPRKKKNPSTDSVDVFEAVNYFVRQTRGLQGRLSAFGFLAAATLTFTVTMKRFMDNVKTVSIAAHVGLNTYRKAYVSLQAIVLGFGAATDLILWEQDQLVSFGVDVYTPFVSAEFAFSIPTIGGIAQYLRLRKIIRAGEQERQALQLKRDARNARRRDNRALTRAGDGVRGKAAVRVAKK